MMGPHVHIAGTPVNQAGCGRKQAASRQVGKPRRRAHLATPCTLFSLRQGMITSMMPANSLSMCTHSLRLRAGRRAGKRRRAGQ